MLTPQTHTPILPWSFSGGPDIDHPTPMAPDRKKPAKKTVKKAVKKAAKKAVKKAAKKAPAKKKR